MFNVGDTREKLGRELLRNTDYRSRNGEYRNEAEWSSVAIRSSIVGNYLKKRRCLQLFDFDFEVQPILEKLVGKTMEEALIEVLEEEEIAALKEQQRKFMELRAAEKAEEKRLEEQERRIREEKVGRRD